MMIDATALPKVGFISHFVTTDCNVNHINAGTQLLPEAEATQERTLEAVSCSPMLAGGRLGHAHSYFSSIVKLSSFPVNLNGIWPA